MTRVGIFGATGYTGHELMHILAHHPHAEIVALGSQSQSGIEVTLPRRSGQSLKQSKMLKLLSPEEALSVPMDAAFLCMSHGAGAQIAADALGAGIKVIDLSADYRLKSADVYSSIYGDSHPAPDAFAYFSYGLPELFREKIRTARGCANPGCYPTTVALALAPLLKNFRLTEGAPLIVDAKSGVSGAGRKPTDSTHFVSVHENFRPYNVGRSHRHVPEMEQTLSDYAPDFRNRILFTPGVLPVTRGMISSVYVPLSESLTQSELFAVFEDFYQSEPFIHILGDGRATPDLSQVRGTNDALISLHAVDQTALVIVAIDNLVKGASGQAVQNFNLMMGFGETDGLLRTKTTP
jgi:N-acetyl-gamma-glutamyl-phosphate reductase